MCYCAEQIDYRFGSTLKLRTYSVLRCIRRVSAATHTSSRLLLIIFFVCFHVACRAVPHVITISLAGGQPSEPAANEKTQNYTYQLIQVFFFCNIAVRADKPEPDFKHVMVVTGS